jgi:hypothetical protein
MFVTSDIFNCEQIGRYRGLDWQEHLLCGVDVHGVKWPGHEAGARFLLEATKRCGLAQEMRYAGYNRPDEARTRPILPKSFDRLARGELSGAREAESVLFRGERRAHGAYDESILFGGTAESIRRKRGPTGPVPVSGPPWRFSANFGFPLNDDPITTATALFNLAVDILGAQYGYFFVRDALCGPSYYTHGISAPLDYKALSYDDAEEVSGWADFVNDGRLWSGDWPKLRDLFQVNLLSERHMSVAVSGKGHLGDWIDAQPGRGRIESIGQGRWLWTLSDREMVDVRPVLNRAGLLLSCRQRVYRDLPSEGKAAI